MGSGRCDCAEQLTRALQAIHANGSGMVIYEKGQEGRGVGLVEKVHAYNLLENRPEVDTFQANQLLGHHEDLRDFNGAAEVLLALGVKSLQLMTSNPEKVMYLVGRFCIPLLLVRDDESVMYLAWHRCKRLNLEASMWKKCRPLYPYRLRARTDVTFR